MLALEWNAIEGGADLAYESGSLRQGDELATAAFLSLFCDAPARDVDPIAKDAPRSGFWGDSYETEHPGDVFGSRLWTLKRWPLTDSVIPVAIEMVEEALAWMVEDGIAESVTGLAEIYRGASNFLAIGVEIKRPGEVASSFRQFWNSVTGETL